MPKVKDVCRYVRSKNAGPFWITVDFFFEDDHAFKAYSEHPVFQPDGIALTFATPSAQVKRQSLPELNVVKVSYPRRAPQGGVLEREHARGQQYVRLLELEV